MAEEKMGGDKVLREVARNKHGHAKTPPNYKVVMITVPTYLKWIQGDVCGFPHDKANALIRSGKAVEFDTERNAPKASPVHRGAAGPGPDPKDMDPDGDDDDEFDGD